MDKEKLELLIECVKFYIDSITSSGTKCPTIDEMRKIVKLDDILKGLQKKA